MHGETRRTKEPTADDRQDAGRIGEEFGLGGLLTVANFLTLAALVWGIGGLLFIWPQPGSRALKVGYGVVIAHLIVHAATEHGVEVRGYRHP